jgi:hypothetical protein
MNNGPASISAEACLVRARGKFAESLRVHFEGVVTAYFLKKGKRKVLKFAVKSAGIPLAMRSAICNAYADRM